jgi:hypothetical protein
MSYVNLLDLIFVILTLSVWNFVSGTDGIGIRRVLQSEFR